MELFKKENSNIGQSVFYIVAVKDELTGNFLQPTFGDNMDALLRIFRTQINSLPIWKDNPTDFSLYKLGTFNQETGQIYPEFEKITSGQSVRERSNE